MTPSGVQRGEGLDTVAIGSRSPRVTHSSWGRLEVEGIGPGKDFKLYPGGGRPWDWGETGTSHHPGIEPADVEELLDLGADVVILTRGRELRLHTAASALALLEERGVTVHVEETEAAIALYNRLAEEGVRVGGLFHSTC